MAIGGIGIVVIFIVAALFIFPPPPVQALPTPPPLTTSPTIPPPPAGNNVVTAVRQGNNIICTFTSGSAADVGNFSINLNGEIQPARLPGTIGISQTLISKGTKGSDHVVVVAFFKNGAQRVVLDSMV